MEPRELIAPSVLDIVDVSRVADVSLSSVAAVSVALEGTRVPGNTFDILATVDCFIAVSADPSGVTTANGYPLMAGNTVSLYVPKGYKIGAITSGSTGTMYIHRSK